MKASGLRRRAELEAAQDRDPGPLRGQLRAGSLAREFNSRNLHVVHAIIDGIIWSDVSKKRFDG